MNETVDGRTGEVIPEVAPLVRVPTAGEGGLDLLAILEKRAKLLERVLDYAIKATHPEQWSDFSGKPWPGGPACEAMARRCGVSITNVKMNKRPSSDDKGSFYIYEVTGTISLPSGFDSIEAVGTCSSRDNFLGTETSSGRVLSEIDEGSIMKAAYTNFTVNGVTRLLGVRSLSWDRLKELGIERGRMSRVAFNDGAKGGGQQASGSDLVLKFGKQKDKRLGEISDEDLTWYTAAFERDATTTDPEKQKYKGNAEKQLAAAKAEQARRANAKAGTEAKPSTTVTIYQRVQQLLGAAGIAPEKQGEWTKGITGKTHPKDLVEEDVAAVQTALAKEKAQAGGDGW